MVLTDNPRRAAKKPNVLMNEDTFCNSQRITVLVDNHHQSFTTLLSEQFSVQERMTIFGSILRCMIRFDKTLMMSHVFEDYRSSCPVYTCCQVAIRAFDMIHWNGTQNWIYVNSSFSCGRIPSFGVPMFDCCVIGFANMDICRNNWNLRRSIISKVFSDVFLGLFSRKQVLLVACDTRLIPMDKLLSAKNDCSVQQYGSVC
ncbi:hypothetical protein CLF_108938 [Clonorchis sinensis]|uniref:Uncharacterized protein n=1 Tax=Clonorchis sinensis TaxID=79923 RepID=G7YS28_CLOSI|nr:hypothetical protein CLF_108938 [Clonorchis sinensis]